MNKLIKEISAIVLQYGVDIVTEERFVNILKDLYPDRDNPEKFEILKVIVTEGISADMYTDCEGTTAKSFLEKKSRFLSRKYGFDTKDVTQVLACLCIGSGFLTIDEYSAAIGRKTPTPKPSNPQPQPKPQPAPVKPSQRKKQKDPFDFLSLIWALFGLFVSPFVYLGLVSGGWWPFLALGVVILIYCLTVMASINQNSKPTAKPAIVGGVTAITLCAAVFMAVGPFIIHWTRDSFDFCHIYYGFKVEESPTIATLILGLTSAFMFSKAVNTNEISQFSSRYFYKTDDGNVLKGFFLTSLAIIAMTGLAFYLPSHDKNQEVLRLEKEKENLKQEEQRIAELREKRSTEVKEMSFMDFTLGGSLRNAMLFINNSYDYLAPMSASHHLYVNQIDFESIVDTAIYVSTNWDNEQVDLYLYSNKNKIIAIEMRTNHDIDSLLSIYSDKYGPPEYVPHIDYSEYKYRQDSLIEDAPSISKTEYQWTFKNALLQIETGRMVENSGHYGNSVLYFDRESYVLSEKLNNELKQEQLKQIEEENAAAQRLKDSIKRVVEKERLEKKQNHEKSIKQI